MPCANDAGSFNSFFGHKTGQYITSGSNNVFIGAYAGFDDGVKNAAIGVGCGTGTAGSYNSFFGHRAGTGYGNTGVSRNCFFGAYAGTNATGGDNVAIGNDAAVGGFSSCIVLGSRAEAEASNRLAIGSVTNPLETTNTAGAVTKYLVIRLNGVNYKLPLHAVS